MSTRNSNIIGRSPKLPDCITILSPINTIMSSPHTTPPLPQHPTPTPTTTHTPLYRSPISLSALFCQASTMENSCLFSAKEKKVDICPLSLFMLSHVTGSSLYLPHSLCLHASGGRIAQGVVFVRFYIYVYQASASVL